MSSKPLYFIAAVLAASFNGCKSEESNQKSQSEIAAKTLVEVVVVSKGNLAEKLETTGSLIANESTQLSIETGGIVDHIYFEEGSRVEKGQLLLELVNNDIKAELQAAKVKLDLSEKKFNRSKKLLDAKGLSEETFEEAESNFNELKAIYQQINADLIKTQVRAPFSGQVGLRNISEGDYLSSNNSFADLVDVNPLKIEFDLPEQYINIINTGDSISFTTALSSQEMKAVVYAIEPQINKNSRTFSAKAKFGNDDKKLRAGGFVRVNYRAKKNESALLIPNQAIVPELDGKIVYVVENGKAVSKNVITGIRNADRIQVLKGLEAGDTIVTTGLLQIRDGASLQLRMDESFGTNPKSAQ